MICFEQKRRNNLLKSFAEIKVSIKRILMTNNIKYVNVYKQIKIIEIVWNSECWKNVFQCHDYNLWKHKRPKPI